jgi:hypothetical protein
MICGGMDKCRYLKYMSGELAFLKERILQRTMSNGRSQIRSRRRPADDESFVERCTNPCAVFDRLHDFFEQPPPRYVPLECGITIVEYSWETMLRSESDGRMSALGRVKP